MIRQRERRQQGMTLIEVMVAVSILGVALAAMMRNLSQSTVDLSYLQEKSIAQWIAKNQLIETRLVEPWPPTGTKRDDVDMVGTRWYWERTVTKTSDPGLLRIDIRVRRDEDAETPLVRLTGFTGNSELIE